MDHLSSPSNYRFPSPYRQSHVTPEPIEDCKCSAFPPLLVGAKACGTCVLAYFVKLVDLHRRSALAANASGIGGVLSGPFCNRVRNNLTEIQSPIGP